MTWEKFIESHKHVLAACDFFTTEVLTKTGLVTYYVLFFIHLATRKIHIAGITPYPNEAWIKQIARNITMVDIGFLDQQKYLIHDRDTKFCISFREILKSAGIKPIRLPPFSPNLNAYAERFVRSVKEECLSKLILFGENSLRRTLNQYLVHYHHERNHQGLQNEILFPDETLRPDLKDNPIVHTKRLNFLSYYFYGKSGTDGNSGHFRLYPTELLTNYG